MAWRTPRKPLQAIDEVSINAKSSQLQNAHLEKSKNIVKYLCESVELVAKLESAQHVISEIEEKHALLRRLPMNYDFTV